MPPEGTEVFDWWLRNGFVYGIAVVFTAGILGGFLYGFLWMCAVLARILSTRLPGWFDDQAATNLEVRKGMQAIVSNSAAILSHAFATQRGMRDAVRAAHKFANKNRTRLGIGSDVLQILKDARATLRNGDPDDEDGDDEEQTDAK